MIARKLLNTHMSGVSERDIEEIVENLASKLFFHGHPINRGEAEKDLQLKIAKDVKPEIEEAMWRLFVDFEIEFRNRERFQPFVDLAATLQPWSAPQAPPSPGGPSPHDLPQLAHETVEVPLVMVESATSSSVQTVRRRFTLISTYGQPDQPRVETLGFGWSRTPAPAP